MKVFIVEEWSFLVLFSPVWVKTKCPVSYHLLCVMYCLLRYWYETPPWKSFHCDIRLQFTVTRKFHSTEVSVPLCHSAVYSGTHWMWSLIRKICIHIKKIFLQQWFRWSQYSLMCMWIFHSERCNAYTSDYSIIQTWNTSA